MFSMLHSVLAKSYVSETILGLILANRALLIHPADPLVIFSGDDHPI